MTQVVVPRNQAIIVVRIMTDRKQIGASVQCHALRRPCWQNWGMPTVRNSRDIVKDSVKQLKQARLTTWIRISSRSFRRWLSSRLVHANGSLWVIHGSRNTSLSSLTSTAKMFSTANQVRLHQTQSHRKRSRAVGPIIAPLSRTRFRVSNLRKLPQLVTCLLFSSVTTRIKQMALIGTTSCRSPSKASSLWSTTLLMDNKISRASGSKITAWRSSLTTSLRSSGLKRLKLKVESNLSTMARRTMSRLKMSRI